MNSSRSSKSRALLVHGRLPAFAQDGGPLGDLLIQNDGCMDSLGPKVTQRPTQLAPSRQNAPVVAVSQLPGHTFLDETLPFTSQ